MWWPNFQVQGTIKFLWIKNKKNAMWWNWNLCD